MQDFPLLIFLKRQIILKRLQQTRTHTPHTLSACVQLVITPSTSVVLPIDVQPFPTHTPQQPPPHTPIHSPTHHHLSPFFDFVKWGTVVGGMPWGGKGCHTIPSSPQGMGAHHHSPTYHHLHQHMTHHQYTSPHHSSPSLYKHICICNHCILLQTTHFHPPSFL